MKNAKRGKASLPMILRIEIFGKSSRPIWSIAISMHATILSVEPDINPILLYSACISFVWLPFSNSCDTWQHTSHYRL